MQHIISIHALREEDDGKDYPFCRFSMHFYPRPPRGGRPAWRATRPNSEVFLSTPSARRATYNLTDLRQQYNISIHALREEGDDGLHRAVNNMAISIHALREEGDERRIAEYKAAIISIHALREEGDAESRDNGLLSEGISIHALREEGDPPEGQPGRRGLYFYPRPPRGGRHAKLDYSAQVNVFLSTPSARRATAATLTLRAQIEISIHALREEDDVSAGFFIGCPQHFYPRPPRGGRRTQLSGGKDGEVFLSTPSARRATCISASRCDNRGISIHALREEGDHYCTNERKRTSNFYPRPPRGGRHGQQLETEQHLKFLSTPSARRATHRTRQAVWKDIISIHALREEGDCPPAL